jgi:hypothetical protein
MLLRLVRKVEWKSEQRLDKWCADRRAETDSLIRAFRDSLIIHGSDDDSAARTGLLFIFVGERLRLAPHPTRGLPAWQIESRQGMRRSFGVHRARAIVEMEPKTRFARLRTLSSFGGPLA